MKKFLTVMGKDFLKFLNTIGLPILLLLFIAVVLFLSLMPLSCGVTKMIKLNI